MNDRSQLYKKDWFRDSKGIIKSSHVLLYQLYQLYHMSIHPSKIHTPTHDPPASFEMSESLDLFSLYFDSYEWVSHDNS